MHNGIRGIELRDDLGHVGISGSTEDVIDHEGACFEGFERHLVVVCPRLSASGAASSRPLMNADALPLLVCTYFRADGLTPNIKYVGTCESIRRNHCTFEARIAFKK